MTCDITTPAQFRMRRLIRGWKREMEEKRAVQELKDDAAIDQIMSMSHDELVEDCRLRGTTIEAEAAHVQSIFEKAVKECLEGKTSDSLKLHTVRVVPRPWQPSDDEPDGGSAA